MYIGVNVLLLILYYVIRLFNFVTTITSTVHIATCIKLLVIKAYLVSCFSHHLFASGPPNCGYGDDPVKVCSFQWVVTTTQLTNELVLEIFEDVSNDVNEVVLFAIACGDLHVPVH